MSAVFSAANHFDSIVNDPVRDLTGGRGGQGNQLGAATSAVVHGSGQFFEQLGLESNLQRFLQIYAITPDWIRAHFSGMQPDATNFAEWLERHC